MSLPTQEVIDGGKAGKTVKNSPYGGGNLRAKYGWGTPFQGCLKAFSAKIHVTRCAVSSTKVATQSQSVAQQQQNDDGAETAAAVVASGTHTVVAAPAPPSSSSTTPSSESLSVLVPAVPIHIGTSSLNAVPPLAGSKGAGGGDKRSMGTLLRQYLKKFRVLEHCQPYHNIGEMSVWEKWNTLIPPDCQVTVKANDWMTHVRRLEFDDDMREHIHTFFGDRCRRLSGNKLGAVLVQLPPSFAKTSKNIRNLRLVAEEIQRIPGGGRIRVAVEFRDRSWNCEEVYALLREFRWGLVVNHFHDVGFSPFVNTQSPILYVRLHGAVGLYEGDYGAEFLGRFAEHLRRFLQQSADADTATSVTPPSSSSSSSPSRLPEDVYVFFNNNDTHVGRLCSSIVDATKLAEVLSADHTQSDQTGQSETASVKMASRLLPPFSSSCSTNKTVATSASSAPASSTSTKRQRSCEGGDTKRTHANENHVRGSTSGREVVDVVSDSDVEATTAVTGKEVNGNKQGGGAHDDVAAHDVIEL